MFYNKQKSSGNNNKKEEVSLRDRLIAAFKKNYTTSFFLLCMFIGWVLDLSLNTMPKYTVTGMVAGAVIGSCVSVKKRNEEKEKKDPKNGKKLL
jgi:F0F1-type ATP synthase assembly protein I